MITPAVTPRGEFILISVYHKTGELPPCAFISRLPGHRKGEKRALRHYRNITSSSAGRLAAVASSYVQGDQGKVFPHANGWSFQGFVPLTDSRA